VGAIGLIPADPYDSEPSRFEGKRKMAEEHNPAPQAAKSEWVKPEVALVEAGSAEFAPVNGSDSYYNFS
jgi:hypothetical protein